MIKTSTLLEKKSQHTETALSAEQLSDYLSATPEWALDTTDANKHQLTRTFNFHNYYETLAFMNAIAYVIHAEDHHPDLLISYNRCEVRFNTHTVNDGKGGISENDFICAAKVDAIYQQSFS